MTLSDPPAWTGPSGDPNDEQFGDVVARATPETLEGERAVLVGEPYDGGVIGRPGAREGPAAIRGALAATKTRPYDGPAVDRVADVGDVTVAASADVRTAQGRAREVAATLHAADPVPVFLGGDNSLSYPNAAPLLDSGSLGVVSLDAHLDCRELVDGPNSGTPYRQLHDAGLDTLVVLGARHFETSSAYVDYLDDRDGTVLTADGVASGPRAAADRALAALGDVDVVYVSVDVDVLTAAAAPAVSAPTPGGLSTRELFAVVRRLATDDRVRGFEVVECAPPLADGDRTAVAAARTVAHVLGGLARRGSADGGGDGREATALAPDSDADRGGASR